MTSRGSELVKTFQQHGKDAQNWWLPRWRWWLLTLKAAVCLLLDLEGTDHRSGWANDHDDIDEVAYLSTHSTWHPEFGAGGEFEVLNVARGWRHWHVHHEASGWP